jgi:uncharacterized peroxidase-related enzyme
MPWIRTVPEQRAEGLLRQIYDAALRRAGKVFNIISLQSLRPRTLRASTQLYMEVMMSADSGLSRAQREMIATAVSSTNGCRY